MKIQCNTSWHSQTFPIVQSDSGTHYQLKSANCVLITSSLIWTVFNSADQMTPFCFYLTALQCFYPSDSFWTTVCKTVNPMISDRCLSVRNVGVLWPNGWTDQDEAWHAGRPQPWPHCDRCGPSSPSAKGAQPPIFGPCLLWPNGWMDQDATCYAGTPEPRPQCARWGPSCPPQKSRHSLLPNFRPMFVVAKRLDGSRCHLVRW